MGYREGRWWESVTASGLKAAALELIPLTLLLKISPGNLNLESWRRCGWMEWTCEKQVVMSKARSRLYKRLQCSAWTAFLGCQGPRPQTLWGIRWWFPLSLFPGELFSIDKRDLVQEIMHTPPSGGSSQPVTTLHVVQKAVPFALKWDNSTGQFMFQRFPTSP